MDKYVSDRIQDFCKFYVNWDLLVKRKQVCICPITAYGMKIRKKIKMFAFSKHEVEIL